MTITRAKLADLIDAYDADIRGSNEAKAAEFAAYREQMEQAGYTKDAIKAEIAACKKAIRKRQAIAAGKPVEEAEDLADAVYLEIATRDAHVRAA
jgi:hypothetical protein